MKVRSLIRGATGFALGGMAFLLSVYFREPIIGLAVSGVVGGLSIVGIDLDRILLTLLRALGFAVGFVAGGYILILSVGMLVYGGRRLSVYEAIVFYVLFILGFVVAGCIGAFFTYPDQMATGMRANVKTFAIGSSAGGAVLGLLLLMVGNNMYVVGVGMLLAYAAVGALSADAFDRLKSRQEIVI